MSDSWYVADGTERHGPFSKSEVELLLDAGKISAETLIWHPGLGEWTAAAAVPELRHAFIQLRPGPEPLPPTATPPPLPASRESGGQVRPWVRYWARNLDMIVAVLLLGIVLGLLGFSFETTNGAGYGMLTLFLWVPVEALLLSTWGYTPGKWLLRIRVTGDDGKQLDAQRAFQRSYRVWLAGIGVGFPLATLVTQWFQYDKLTKTGETTYDRNGHFVVHHRNVGLPRVVFTTLLFASFVGLVVSSQA